MTYTPAICIGSVNNETGDDTTIIKIISIYNRIN